MAAPLDNIRCGIAGWSYPDWKGCVYDVGTKDELRFVAPYFDVIEINSTFYRPPNVRTCESWARRTQDLAEFFFTAKLHRSITHEGDIDPAVAKAFQLGMAPLVAGGKLRHLLAQFRYDFDDTSPHRIHLSRIKECFGNIANLTLELRHNSWQSSDGLAFLGSLGVTVANLDYPMGARSFNLRRCNIGDHAYMRLHGRNSKAWFSKAGRDATYNYRYPQDELKEIVERAVQIAARSKTLTLIANNHYAGKEAANALEIKSMITGKKVRVPPMLLKKYPDLERISQNGPC